MLLSAKSQFVAEAVLVQDPRERTMVLLCDFCSFELVDKVFVPKDRIYLQPEAKLHLR